MQGEGGVTNYSVAKPSYAFTDATTEFDDALVQRGIVTKEQVLLAKGMAPETAQQLLNMNNKGNAPVTQQTAVSLIDSKDIDAKDIDDDLDDQDADILDQDDDDFLSQYRQKRLEELKRKHQARFGEAVPIDRTEWTRHVNEASGSTWVVVCLTSSDAERTGRAEAAVKALATDHGNTKFVLIPSHSAIPNWPETNLPSLFLYNNGVMQHELLRLPTDLTKEQLEDRLRGLGVFSEEEGEYDGVD